VLAKQETHSPEDEHLDAGLHQQVHCTAEVRSLTFIPLPPDDTTRLQKAQRIFFEAGIALRHMQIKFDGQTSL